MTIKEFPPIKRPPKAVITRIQSKEAKHKGLVAAIEPKTGDYFLGKNTIEAVQKGREKYPGMIFYCIRIGYRAVHELHGGWNER